MTSPGQPRKDAPQATAYHVIHINPASTRKPLSVARRSTREGAREVALRALRAYASAGDLIVQRGSDSWTVVRHDRGGNAYRVNVYIQGVAT